MADSTVKWYGEQVLLKVKDATDAVLTDMAYMGEAQAKVNETMVDTGFLRSTVYAATPKGDSYAPEFGLRTDGRAAGPVRVGKGEAAIGAAAEYAIYIEMKINFLYRSLEWLVSQFGGTISRHKL